MRRSTRFVAVLGSLFLLSACYTSEPARAAGGAGDGHLQVLPGDLDAGVDAAPRPYDYTWLLSLGVDLPPLHDGGMTPDEPVGWNEGARIDVGGDHACALTRDGKIYCWGANGLGQVGSDVSGGAACPEPLGDFSCEATPHEVVVPSGHSRWAAVSAGHTHSCGLTDNGAAFCWGSNGSGELGNGTHAASYNVATPTPVAVAGGLRFTAIAAGEHHTCGIADGAAYCWGANEDSELGSAVAADTCLYGACAMTPSRVGADSDWDAIEAGGQITCGLRSGALYCWGWSGNPQLGRECNYGEACATEVTAVGSDTDWASVSVWASGTCAIKVDGSLWCWGGDAVQLGNNPTPTEVALGARATSVAVGENHTCATLQSGALFCWGLEYSGELGDGPGSPSDCDGFGCTAEPVRIGNNFQQVSAGYSFNCSIKQSGTLACWGNNRYGQLGTTTTETCDTGSGELESCSTAPVNVASP